MQKSLYKGLTSIVVYCYMNSGVCMLLSKLTYLGSSLLAQWLGFWAFTDAAFGSVPGWGTEILQAVWHSQEKKMYLKMYAVYDKKKQQQKLLCLPITEGLGFTFI